MAAGYLLGGSFTGAVACSDEKGASGEKLRAGSTVGKTGCKSRKGQGKTGTIASIEHRFELLLRITRLVTDLSCQKD